MDMGLYILWAVVHHVVSIAEVSSDITKAIIHTGKRLPGTLPPIIHNKPIRSDILVLSCILPLYFPISIQEPCFTEILDIAFLSEQDFLSNDFDFLLIPPVPSNMFFRTTEH
jgi:hypothetical protein